MPATHPSPFVQTVTIKDYLIVSIGDSYASGEGNPDKPQVVNVLGEDWNFKYLELGDEAVWQDLRCHRSVNAGPARAALDIEEKDAKTSVTFLSFACSGATINTDMIWDDDPTHTVGSGILGGFRGRPPDSVGYSEAERLPAQLQAVHDLVQERQIDALIISGGGNDIGFGNIAALSAGTSPCQDTKVLDDFRPNDNGRKLSAVVADKVAGLGPRYDALATAIHDPNSAWHLNVANVLLSEYPDFTRGNNADYCSSILNDIAPFYDMGRDESQWAISNVATPLNQAMRDAVARQVALGRPWRYVTGVRSAFAGSTTTSPVTPGHGYCASSHWVNTASESILIQGPLPSMISNGFGFTMEEVNAKRNTVGTIHPNASGHYVYMTQILANLRPYLR